MTTMAVDGNGASMPAVSLTTVEAISISVANAQSSAFAANVYRFTATEACILSFGDDPDAAAGGHLLPSGVVEYLKVTIGQKVGVVTVTGTGILYVSRCG